MEDTLTASERTLVKMGRHRRLRDMRLFFQYSTIREFRDPVERITGRKVRSFHDTKVEGFAIETFIFYPEGQDGPSRGDIATEDEA